MGRLTDVLALRFPIFQAPMAGGPDTPVLAGHVSEAGGLGSLGCGYLSPEAMKANADAIRALTKRSFGINLFFREDPPDDLAALARVREALRPFRRQLGLPEAEAPLRALPSVESQLEAVLSLKPRVFSFTFGLPRPEQLERLRGAGIFTLGTATSLEEGEALESLGVDAVCAQGSEAGGHRGTFLGAAEDSLVGTLALTRQLVTRLRVPVVAAGGIMDGAGIRAALELGAAAVQLGTAFMLCPEAGTAPAHREALKSALGQHTVVTRAFSGRAARGIRNRLALAFGEGRQQEPPTTFPQQQAMTAELRAAAAAQGRTELMQMWAGQNAVLLREMPAAELVATLAREAGL